MYLYIAQDARTASDRMFYASGGLLTNCAQWNSHRNPSRAPHSFVSLNALTYLVVFRRRVAVERLRQKHMKR